MVMDVHDRFRTESHSQTSGRFNERFLLSLASCKACVVMDDELNILPLSSDHIRSITQVPTKEEHLEYDVVRSVNPDFKKATVRINIYRQTIQRMMALCVSSHYKNSPNDLQLLADAPAHHLFVLLAITLLLLTLCGVSTATPVLTIQSPNGDTIDCFNRMDQPALKNPLLKNHIIQEIPSHMVKTGEEGFGWQVWHATGTTCPHGTIPIRRFQTNISHTKYASSILNAADRPANGHQYAIVQVKGQPIYGTKARLNVWNPVVQSPHDFSLAQIWLVSGEYKNNDINTIEAGWQIFPHRYHDHQPRLFTYWTRDAYLHTGCYSTHCGGFVHVSSIIALEAAIARTSTFGGDQFDITLQIWKDLSSGNWWLGMGVDIVLVGYWPAEIFTTLSNHASTVQWGGEVLYQNTSGMNSTRIKPTAQMGSGKYVEKGFREAAYFCNLQIAHKNRTFLPVQNFTVVVTQPESYTVQKTHNEACGSHFYYGGPGPVPLRSASVRRNPTFFTFLVLSFFVVV